MLTNGSTIGVTVMLAGVGRKLDEYKLSVSKIEENGFKVFETESVRVNTLFQIQEKLELRN